MGYFWQQCGDPYNRIAAWRSSYDVYVLMKDGWFLDSPTKVKVRFLPREADLELLIGDGNGSLDNSFIKLSANHGTSIDRAKQAIANRQVLARQRLTPEDLIKASTREIERYRSKAYVARYSDTLVSLCNVSFRGQTL